MDNFWFWAGLTWNVMVAWFLSLPWGWQIAAAFVVAYALICLLAAIVTTTARIVRWARGPRKPRLTLVEAQVERTTENTEETLVEVALAPAGDEKKQAKLQDHCARTEEICAEFRAHTTVDNQRAALHAIWTMRARLDHLESVVREIQPDEAPDTGKLEAVR